MLHFETCETDIDKQTLRAREGAVEPHGWVVRVYVRYLPQ